MNGLTSSLVQFGSDNFFGFVDDDIFHETYNWFSTLQEKLGQLQQKADDPRLDKKDQNYSDGNEKNHTDFNAKPDEGNQT